MLPKAVKNLSKEEVSVKWDSIVYKLGAGNTDVMAGEVALKFYKDHTKKVITLSDPKDTIADGIKAGVLNVADMDEAEKDALLEQLMEAKATKAAPKTTAKK